MAGGEAGGAIHDQLDSCTVDGEHTGTDANGLVVNYTLEAIVP